ncbi:4-hydroxybenzoate polyprenyl transferase [Viridothelium virens]|uniref:4-hydroxybenzoate polyprenyltransferase, mitochondrial n=1 Tax=Viridothelium virens TaxID=1048519 RepID=A0A6A6HBF1_VIRVR|nr:4-hydroxybenzoate polyprenyl transferase [Viridothelium virens]
MVTIARHASRLGEIRHGPPGNALLRSLLNQNNLLKDIKSSNHTKLHYSLGCSIRLKQRRHSFCDRTSCTHGISWPLQFHTASTNHDRTRSTVADHDIPIATQSRAYAPPRAGLLSYLPASVVPFAELIRLDKPVGTYYLFFPCLFSTLLAAPLTIPITPPLTILSTTSLFFLGALIMRGAGCTINDLWDRNLDPHVARTRLRPIARGAISPQTAIIFTGFQLLAGLGVLVSFPPACFFYGAPSLLLVATYPLAKRVTYYPQFVLGLTFSWGAFMGFPALGLDLLSDANLMLAAGTLYASNVAWTVLYDMIYAHMDIRDDATAGIKSIALRHERNTKAVLSGLAAVQVGLLGLAGWTIGAGPVYYVGSCGGAIASLGLMIWRVRLKSVESCWWWFRYGCWFTGGAIALGLLGEYGSRVVAKDKHEERNS